ncbi:unnamed protein product [Adineta steineri]|uniref:Hexosyltransferase n=1 Tax=Adineta steineri TaxID=433720 RepID=A0A819A6B9_9BILA|nr:unnamed protein product [Adineta steineri]
MKYIVILFYLFYTINARNTRPPRVCRNCTGKLHTHEDLELAKRPLIINKDHICLNEKHEFFIIIKSGSYQRRNFTRLTWAKEVMEHFNIPVLYAIGYPKNSSLQKEILLEDEIFHDLLQFDFQESYFNLTIKTTSVFIWYDKYCSKNSKYLFYVDDDLLIHVDKLILYIMKINSTDTIEGWWEKSGKILRTGIGGVTKEDFPIDIVPDYLWGAAVLYPSNVISNILLKFIYNTTLPIFFRDDVFINGFVADEAKIKRQQMNGLLLYDPSKDLLKDNMIVVDFKTEKDRQRAWNCYKHNTQCNENLLLFLFQILFGMSLSITLMNYCCKWFKTTIVYQYLKYGFDMWCYEVKPIYNEYANLLSMITRKYCPTVRYRKMKILIYCFLSFHSK